MLFNVAANRIMVGHVQFEVACQCRCPGIPRSHEELGEKGALRKLPGQGMFSTSRTNQQDVHAAKSKPVLEVQQRGFSTTNTHLPQRQVGVEG